MNTAPSTRGPDAYCTFLENVTAETLEGLYDLVTPDVRFVDPFNDVSGAQAMYAILADMFEKAGPCTFDITERKGDPDAFFIAWALQGTLFGKPWRVEGTSLIRFDDTGRVIAHHDFWDAASGLYEHMPILGRVLRSLRHRIRLRTSS